MQTQLQSGEKAGSAMLHISDLQRKIIFFCCVLLCLTPYVSPPWAMLLGLLIAQFTGHPYLHLNQKATNLLLKFSVVGLGFGMNIRTALDAGASGILFTFIGRRLLIEKKTSFLICSGTAICGGSAIAAISPVIKAEEKQISVALGCVFILNSIALFIFPLIGHYLNLSQTQFGLWCAMAIHDTSSVVGAAGQYGAKALAVATTVKLARALWIIPVTFVSAFLFKNKSKQISIPYFIGLFIVALVANTYIRVVGVLSPYITAVAKAGLTLTLFLIGAGLSLAVLKSVGIKPLLQGVILWILISAIVLYAVIHLN
jgi:uncharacterized integral membrane protein (TIGR00698 family)